MTASASTTASAAWLSIKASLQTRRSSLRLVVTRNHCDKSCKRPKRDSRSVTASLHCILVLADYSCITCLNESQREKNRVEVMRQHVAEVDQMNERLRAAAGEKSTVQSLFQHQVSRLCSDDLERKLHEARDQHVDSETEQNQIALVQCVISFSF